MPVGPSSENILSKQKLYNSTKACMLSMKTPMFYPTSYLLIFLTNK